MSHSKKYKLDSCFINFNKAFDSIWHNSLFNKHLQLFKLGGHFYNLIKNVYSKTEYSIRHTDQHFLLDQEDTGSIYYITLPNGSNLNCLLYPDGLIVLLNLSQTPTNDTFHPRKIYYNKLLLSMLLLLISQVT